MLENTTVTLSVSVLAAIALPVLLVLVLMVCLSCLNFFKKKTSGGFTNFSNSAADSTTPGNAQVNNSFAVDIEDTDVDNVASTGVTLEPLPDITTKLKLPLPPMRPRLGCLETAKSDASLKLIVTHQTFPRSQIVYLKELGSGWFGKVIESDAVKIRAGVARSKVVVKMLKDDANKDEQRLFFEEAAPFRELEHPHILRLLGQCTEINPMLMILEYAAFGNLKQYLRNHCHELASLMQKNRLIQFALNAASGMACLHEHGYLHRDVAARNCLVMTDHTLKIGDYGIAEDLFKEDYFSAGNELLPIRWMAPETVKQEGGKWKSAGFSKESDVWSFGVLVWEIAMMGERPYDMLTDEAVLQGVIVDKDIHLPEPDTGIANKERLYEVMRFCWMEPSERLKVEEVYKLLEQIASKAPEDGASADAMTAFEQKWEHLMPNQRHESIDSMGDRRGSVSSDDSNLLDDFLEDLASAETTTPSAPPRASRRKLSVRAVNISNVDDESEEVAVTGKKPTNEKAAVPQISVIDEAGQQVKVPPQQDKTGKPEQAKEPASTDTEFTVFTSHSTDDEAGEDTPNVSQIASDAIPSEKTQPEKTPGGEGDVGDIFQVDALSKVKETLEGEGFAFKTPEKSDAQTKARKTSTPMAKGESSSSSSSSFSGGDSTATFVTARSSSPGNLTDGAYATASGNTLVTDKSNIDFTLSSDFSASDEIFSGASSMNKDTFDTTAVPSIFDDFSKSEEESQLTKSDPFSSAASFNESPVTGDGGSAAKDDGFGEFTNGSLLGEKHTKEPAASSASTTLSESVDASASKEKFFSFAGESSEAVSKAQSGQASLAIEPAVQDSDPFVSFGTDFSSLNSLKVPKAAEITDQEQVFPSFSSELSSFNSLATDSTLTPQAEPQSDIFAFDNATPSQATEEKKVTTPDKDLQMNVSGLDELSFDLISSLPDASGGMGGLNAKSDTGKEGGQPSTDLTGDFSTIPLDSSIASKPVTLESERQGDTQQPTPDLFGLGGPGSSMIDSSFEVLHSQEGSKDSMSSSAFSDFDILASFTADTSSSASPSNPFGGGGNLQEFAGSSTAAAVPDLVQKESQDDVLVASTSTEPKKSSEAALLDFSAFESSSTGDSKQDEGNTEKTSSETASSLIDF